MTVVSFTPKAKPQDYIFVCACKCASFELRGDGVAFCRNCGSAANAPIGWKLRTPDDMEFSGQVTYSDGGNDIDFAERKTKRDIMAADWIIAGNDAGLIISWARHFVETPEIEKWLRDGVDAGLAAILGDKPR